MTDVEPAALLRRLQRGHVVTLLVAAAPRAYAQGLLLGLDSGQMRLLLLFSAPFVVAVDGLLVPYLLDAVLIEQALERRHREAPGDRLARILELPRALELCHLAVIVALDLVIACACCHWLRRDLWPVLGCAAVMPLLSAFMMVQHLLWMEQQVRGIALAEFHRTPGAPLPEGGTLWRRLAWHLPYLLALTLACAVALAGVILWRKGGDAVRDLQAELLARGLPGGAALVGRQVARLGEESAVALLLLGAFLIGSAVVFARQMARQIARGTERLRRSIERMAAGAHAFPSWISTDELGRLAAATADALRRLGQVSGRLREMAGGFGGAASELAHVQSSQDALLVRQGELLHQARTTAQEIQRAGQYASQRVEEMLDTAGQAEERGKTAEAAISDVLGELGAIHAQVSGMGAQIERFGERAEHIRSIHTSIEELTRRSRQLALQVAIEAARTEVRSGQGLTNVSRQARALTDQAFRAAIRGRELLGECLGEIRELVELSRLGRERVAVSLSGARESGASLRKLSSGVDESVASARRLAETLEQQRDKVEALDAAVVRLAEATAGARRQLGGAAEVTDRLNAVAHDATALVQAHGWDRGEGRARAGPPRQGHARRLARRLLRGQQVAMAAALVPLVYLQTLLVGLSVREAWIAVFVILPLLSVVNGAIVPGFICRALGAWALEGEGDPERRLSRLLELPRRQELLYLFARGAAYAVFTTVCCALYGLSYGRVLPSTLALVLFSAFISVTLLLRAEQEVRPYAQRELRRAPGASLRWRGLLWRRLEWYLPYVLGLSILCTLSVVGVVAWRKGGDAERELIAALAREAPGAEALVRARVAEMVEGCEVAAGVLGAFLLLGAMVAARRMARGVAAGAREVYACIQGIAAGAPRMPAWISTDEMGRLAVATAAVFQELRQLSRGLKGQAGQLAGAARELEDSHGEQERSLSTQQELVRETRQLAFTITSASSSTTMESERVVATIEGGKGMRRDCEEAVALCQAVLQVVREQVTLLERRLGQVAERVRELDSLTASVGAISHESDMVALNASLEANRSGRHGQGLGVVSREMRALAEMSKDAVRRVGGSLAELNQSLAETMATLRGRAERVRVSLERTQSSSEQLLQLSSLIQQCSGAAVQVAGAVRQQHAGIRQISSSIAHVEQLMSQTTGLLFTSARLSREIQEGSAQLRQAADADGHALPPEGGHA